MARSKGARVGSRNRARYLAYSIPLIAIIGVGIVYGLSAFPSSRPHAAMDFTFKLLIEVSNKNQSNPQVRGVVPGNAIGVAGGYWNTSRYDSYGVEAAHYPLYMDDPLSACPQAVCLIHVKSTVVHQYTLGDFFEVWGKTLGENDTIGVPRSGSFSWQLCLGLAGSAVSSSEWGGLVLVAGSDITLDYYDTVNGLGCAAT